MAHLKNIPPRTRSSIEKLNCPTFETTPFVSGWPLHLRRVAIISTAGLHRRDDERFNPSSSDFRTIAADTDPSDILMSHVSVNYDRTGFLQDINTVLPLDRLADLKRDGVIGSIATNHYSFMGATSPTLMKKDVIQVSEMLKVDQVDAVLLIPV
jgi:D-proline reductase (dithiol) PrdB